MKNLVLGLMSFLMLSCSTKADWETDYVYTNYSEPGVVYVSSNIDDIDFAKEQSNGSLYTIIETRTQDSVFIKMKTNHYVNMVQFSGYIELNEDDNHRWHIKTIKGQHIYELSYPIENYVQMTDKQFLYNKYTISYLND